MGTIPHGNSLLAQGTAIKFDPFTGNPFDPDKCERGEYGSVPSDSGRCLFRGRLAASRHMTLATILRPPLTSERPPVTCLPLLCR